MTLPSYFILQNLNIPTVSVFIAISIMTTLFVFWREGKKEGFNQDKLFDMALSALLLSLLAFRVDPLAVIVLIILILYAAAYYWKWSVFRIMDIFILAVFIGSVPTLLSLVLIYALYEALVPLAVVSVLYFHLNKMRNQKFKSGYVFSLLLLVSSLLAFIFFKSERHLIFYLLLFMISTINIYLRERKSMNKPRIPIELLKSLYKKLLVKDRRLTAEQNMLIESDPYMEAGRANDNAELMDEAILEDNRKEINDARVSALSGMQRQVRRALARIKLGRYGTCEVCGTQIDKARLEAYPEATTCLEHASDVSA
jgi:RNA polymerase-binding transcription factor DksA